MNYNNLDAVCKYLLVSEKDHRNGLAVNCVGFQTIQPNSPYPLSEHPKGYFFNATKGRILNEYQFIYITEGSGILRIESNNIIPISKGQIIVIFPGQWHSYCPTEKSGWNEYYIGFCGEIIETLVKNSFLSKENQLLDVGLNEELVRLFKRAIEIVIIDKIASQQYLLGIVMHMIGLILSEYQNKKLDDKYFQIVESAKIMMNENIFMCIHIKEFADRFNISYSSFRKIFKQYTGFAPIKYFHELKIRKAKQLLLETSHSVKEISYMLKYYSPDSFNTCFKKVTGQTPSKYRLMCRNIS
ncbi:AraC family transcriptional regulator [Flavobacterium sp. UBA6031]|uniref:AraC family transcriptional regulator n=1 Tax=Flavobacterium sp. UBA6031 TaxID=1946551 RepID=UPI0025C4537E|nr:response regulator transcription factor [Flavobacterium sp. UBA6031]